jgi:formylglycine-generating enzyme required for sulfatase activity
MRRSRDLPRQRRLPEACRAALLHVLAFAGLWGSGPAPARGDVLRYDSPTDWSQWSLPTGSLDVMPSGRLQPVALHKQSDAVRDAAAFGHPAVEVSLVGARAYCAWAGKRVPTEAEWQAACEGPERLTFPWGHHLRTGPGQPLRANLFSDTDGYARTAPVGSFPEGRSPYGLWDMGGNVWEWALTDSGEARLRGGSWVNGKSMAECTGSNDVAHSHSYIKMNSVGVRCARTLTPSTEESPE